jgi:hypothetical protein
MTEPPPHAGALDEGAAVAERLGLGSTVERDLQVTPHTAPDYVVGLDGKCQPTRRNGRC